MQDITFNGLTSILKGNIYNVATIRKLAHAFPNSGGNVGSVPPEWLKNIPYAERENFINQLYKIFSGIAKLQINSSRLYNKKCSKLLRDFLVESNVISPKERLRFSYSGSGDFAEVVKFNVGNKKYALKVFSPDNEYFLDINYGLWGNKSEQNNALYIGAKENSDWTRFYFGNVLDGYMVTKYIDNATPLPKKKIKLSDKGLEYLDYKMSNIKNNINLDYGGFKRIVDFPVGNKVAMWTIKKLKKLQPCERKSEILKIEKDKKVPNYYDRMLGAKYVKTHVMPQDEEFNSGKHGFWSSLFEAFLGMYRN